MKWNHYKPNLKKINNIKELYDIPQNIAVILENRGLSKAEDLKYFLSLEHCQFHNPFLMKGMKKVVDRIFKTITLNKNIFIFGDCDADGITSTSLIYNGIRFYGGKAKAFIPNREKEGHGLSIEAIDQALDYKSDILITCDCGMGDYEIIKYANQYELDVIIIDHHFFNNKLPNAFAILNPKQLGCQYPFKDLSGSGIALKLIQALINNTDLNQELFNESINFAILGTLSDMVPLKGENRLIVYHGLKNISKTSNLGFQKLLKNFKTKKKLSVFDLSVYVIPKINSSARIGSSNNIFQFLTSKQKEIVNLFYNEIELNNKRRLNIQKIILNEVFKFIKNEINLNKEKAIICFSKNWNYGILGLIASKIKNHFNRPVILISFDNNGYGRGSARSIKNFNIIEALDYVKVHLVRYGGHDMAAGFEIKESDFKIFKELLLGFVNLKLKKKNLKKTLNIDLELKFSDLNFKFLKFLKKLEPYGFKNDHPIFKVKNVKVIGNPKVIGNGEHIKFKVEQNKFVYNVIGYGLIKLYDILISGFPLDIVFFIEQNNWKGRDIVQLNVRDIRLSNIKVK